MDDKDIKRLVFPDHGHVYDRACGCADCVSDELVLNEHVRAETRRARDLLMSPLPVNQPRVRRG